MTLTARISLTAAISSFLLGMPFTMAACGEISNEVSGAVYQTPFSARGRFVFVQRVSRRLLRAQIMEQRLANRSVLQKAQL